MTPQCSDKCRDCVWFEQHHTATDQREGECSVRTPSAVLSSDPACQAFVRRDRQETTTQ